MPAIAAAKVVQYNVADQTAAADAIQTSYARFAAGGFRRPHCVSPGSRMIASHRSTSRMIYATKNGLMRVLDQSVDGSLPVIDHHKTDTVHDIVFFPQSGVETAAAVAVNQLWASVASKRVVLWHGMSIVLDIEMPIVPIKLIWNYADTNRFYVLCEDGTALFIDAARGLPGPSKHPEHQYMMCSIPKDLSGISSVQAQVVDIAWSPFTMEYVAIIHSDGSLRLSVYDGTQMKEMMQIETGIVSPSRCAFVGPNSVLVTSDENRTMTLFQGKDLSCSGVLKLTGTNDSFVMETLLPDDKTSRIVLTSRDSGDAMVVGLNLQASSPFETVFPFHSTMAGYSFHCTVVPNTDTENVGGRNIKLTLYGPKEIQTWILQEQPACGIRPLMANNTAVDDMAMKFADYTVEDEDEEESEVVEDAAKSIAGPPGLELAVSANPFVNWVGGLSAQSAGTPSVQKQSLPTPPLPALASAPAIKQPTPPPQPRASPPPVKLAMPSPKAPTPKANTTVAAVSASRERSPAQAQAMIQQQHQASLVAPTVSSIDMTELTTSIRSIIKEELVQQSSAISASVARSVMIPAIESITQQILEKVSNHVDQQQAQDRLQLENMSNQLTKVTHLMGALTKDVQLIQSQQQQTQQTSRSAAQPPTPEQIEAKIQQQVLGLLKQGNLEQALQSSFSSQKTDLTWLCCQQGDLSDRLGAQPQSLSLQVLFNTMHRLSAHIKTASADADRVEMFLGWIQSICLALADVPINIPAENTNAILQFTLTSCGEVQSFNRRSYQMTVHLLKSLLR